MNPSFACILLSRLETEVIGPQGRLSSQHGSIDVYVQIPVVVIIKIDLKFSWRRKCAGTNPSTSSSSSGGRCREGREKSRLSPNAASSHVFVEVVFQRRGEAVFVSTSPTLLLLLLLLRTRRWWRWRGCCCRRCCCWSCSCWWCCERGVSSGSGSDSWHISGIWISGGWHRGWFRIQRHGIYIKPTEANVLRIAAGGRHTTVTVVVVAAATAVSERCGEGVIEQRRRCSGLSKKKSQGEKNYWIVFGK